MAFYQGVIGTQVATTGATSIVIGDRVFRSSNRPIWDYGVLALSVTQIGTVSFSVTVVGDIQGVTIPISVFSSVGSTNAFLLPIVNQLTVTAVAGTTQTAIMGVPTPKRIVFGNSATPGQTYGAVVSAILWGN